MAAPGLHAIASRDTASAAGICGALQLIANMMIISGTLRETLPSTARGTSSSCCSECGQPSGGEEDNPPWSMEAWLPALADQGVLAVVSQALANVHKVGMAGVQAKAAKVLQLASRPPPPALYM